MSDVVVVDASLAVKWVLAEPDSGTAAMLLKSWTNERKEVTAPALFTYEVTNIIYRRVVTSLLAYEEAVRVLTDLFSIGISLNLDNYKDVSLEAMRFARLFHLPATYDAHYLALAKQENCEFWTADTRLWNSVKSKLSWVHCLDEYEPFPDEHGPLGN